VKSIVSITEKFLDFQLSENFDECKSMEKLIKKCPNYNIDPFGYGFYATAYLYTSYKKYRLTGEKKYPERISRWNFYLAPLER